MSNQASHNSIHAPENTGYIWLPAYTQKPGAAISDLNAAKRDFIELLPPALKSCESKASLNRAELDELLQQLAKRISTGDFAKLVRFVSRSLRKGERELGWNVAVPASQLHYVREGSFFRPDRFLLLHKSRAIQKAVHAFPPTDNWHMEYGRLLLAAMFFGGLLNKAWLTAWLTAVENRNIFRNEHYLWVEMQFPVQWTPHERYGHPNKTTNHDDGQVVMIHRRWFADPLSSLLICRAVANKASLGKVITASLIQSAIKQFLAAANLAELTNLPISKLLLMGEIVLRLEAPANIASYATGLIMSVSLPEPAWTRILSDRLLPGRSDGPVSEETLHNSHTATDTESLAPYRHYKPPARQQDYLKEVRKLLSRKGVSQARLHREILELIELRHLSPITRLLFRWGAYLISREGRNKASTALRYLGAIGNYLIVACDTDDMTDQESSWYQNAYEQVLANIRKEQEKSYAHKTLGLFHRYLVTHHGASPLESTFFITKVGPPELTVDANLITCAEFDRVKILLGYDDPQRSRLATAAIILAILGFRCGLRRNEAYYLRVKDIKWGKRHQEIIVRPYTKRGLKSGAATRRIPLHALLPEDELILIQQWHGTFAESDNILLFSRTGLSDRAYQPEQLFGAVRQALHRATGDSTLRFHHLRHSCLTWLFVRLNGDADNLRTFASFFDHQEFDDIRVQRLRRELLANEALGRKGAYATSLLSGHNDPSTTFRNYIHICDFLLGVQLSQTSSLTKLSIREFSGLADIPEPTVYAYYDKTSGINMSKLLESAAKRAGIMFPPSWNSTIAFSATGTVFEKGSTDAMRWISVMKALDLFQAHKLSAHEISEEQGYQEDTIRSWIANVRYIANLRIPGSQGAYRHRIIAKNIRLAGYDPEGRELWEAQGPQKVYYRAAQHARRSPSPSLLKYSKWKKSVSQQVHAGLFPRPPRTVADKNLLHTIMTAFERLNPQQQLFITDFADFFCENFIINSGGIWHTNPAWGKRHVTAAKLLGIPGSYLQLVDIETAGEPDADIALRRREWEKTLGFKHTVMWVVAEKRLSKKRISCGISIRVLSEPGGKASYAFRYAMYLIRIGYWD